MVADQKARLANFNKNDTGKLSQSLSYEVVETKEGISLEFFYLPYGEFVDSGRKPFLGYPALRLITDPVQKRNRKKAKLGTKPFQIFREGGDVFSKTRLNQLEIDLANAIELDLIEEISNGL